MAYRRPLPWQSKNKQSPCSGVASSACVICILRSDHNVGRVQIRRTLVNTRCECKGSDIGSRYRLHVNTRFKWGYQNFIMGRLQLFLFLYVIMCVCACVCVCNALHLNCPYMIINVKWFRPVVVTLPSRKPILWTASVTKCSLDVRATLGRSKIVTVHSG